MPAELLRLQDVYKDSLLRDFSLNVLEDEIVALVSPSDKSFSTIADILCHGESIDRGNLWLYERHLTSNHIEHPRISGIYHIHRKSSLIPNMSVSENLFLVRPHGAHSPILRRGDRQFQTSTIFEELDLMISPNQRVNELSHLQQLMLELVKSLIYQARIVVLEDNWSDLNPSEFQQLFTMVQKLRNVGASFLILTSHKEALYDFTDRVMVVHQGCTIHNFYRSELTPGFIENFLLQQEDIRTYEPLAQTTGTHAPFAMFHLFSGSLFNASLATVSGGVFGAVLPDSLSIKSLCHALLGEAPYKGQFYINEESFQPKDRLHLFRSGVGLVNPLHDHLFLSLSWTENLALYRHMTRNEKKPIISKGLLRFLEQEHWELVSISRSSAPLHQLNLDKYTQTKLMYLRWIVSKPTVLICANPFHSSDLVMRDVIVSMFHLATQHGISILVLGTDANELSTVCHKVVSLTQEPT